MIEQAWGHGFVHITLLGNLPAGSGSFAQARVAAGYLSKYVAQTFDEAADAIERPKFLHRFDRAQGFPPKTARIWARAAQRSSTTRRVRWTGLVFRRG